MQRSFGFTKHLEKYSKYSYNTTRFLRSSSVGSNKGTDWKKLHEYALNNSTKELKTELIRLANYHGIKSKQVAIITSSIVGKEFTEESISIALDILQCFATEPKTTNSVLYVGLVELFNLVVNKGDITSAMLYFDKLFEVKQMVDLPHTIEKLLQLLCHTGRLNDIDHVINNSHINIHMLTSIAEPYIMSAKLSQFYCHLIKFYNFDNNFTELPKESSVTRLIHSLLYGRLRRHNGRTNATDNEYIYMGKIFEWIENYHRRYMAVNDLGQKEVMKLESYYAYKQLYKVESEALHLTKLNCSPEESIALSIFPEFEQVEFPYLVEDRELPTDVSTNINHACASVDMIHDLTYDLRETSTLLLFHKDVFPEDYVKEYNLIQKTTMASRQIRQKTEAINTLFEMMASNKDEFDEDDEDDDEDDDDELDLNEEDGDDIDFDEDDDEDDDEGDIDIDLDELIEGIDDDEDDIVVSDNEELRAGLDSVLSKNYSHVAHDNTDDNLDDAIDVISMADGDEDEIKDSFYLKCDSLGTVEDSSSINCKDLTSMNPEFKFLDFGTTAISPSLSGRSALSSLGANFFLRLEYIKSNFRDDHSDDDDTGGVSVSGESLGATIDK